MKQEDVNEMVARGNAALGRSQWKPIESAPRDGTHFLAWGVLMPFLEENVHIAYWVEFGGAGDFAEFPFRTGTYGKPQNLIFTHWMPEPKGPAPKTAQRLPEQEK